jgi:purine-binding chemotaxis protein CheW
MEQEGRVMQNDDGTNAGLLVAGFTLGTSDFGVDARLVLEVVKVGEITCVHDAPPGVVGIRNLRGRIVTIVDMAAHLDLGNVEPGPETRLLIMEHQDETFGFLVDSVTDAIPMDAERMESSSSSLYSALKNRLRGVWRDGPRLVAIVDPEALFHWEKRTGA